MNQTLRRTPLYDALKSLGGKMVPFAGYEMPVQFNGIKAEHNAVRTAAGLFDVSHMCEFWLTGPDALSAANWLITNDLTRIEDGQTCYSPMCNEDGGIVDDLIVYKYNMEKILLVVNAACHDKDVDHIRNNLKGDVTFEDKSYQTAQIALQGPLAEQIICSVGGDRFKSLQPFRFVEEILLNAPCIVSRTGYTAEDGFEIYCANHQMLPVFQAIMDTGAPMGLQPIGLGARDTLRLEGRLSLYGNELTLDTSPLEAGLGWTVKLDAGDFVGKRALLKQKEDGITRRLVGFEMIDKGIARHGYPIVSDGAPPDALPIGYVTSGSPSPTLGKNIGLAYVPKKGYKPGATFAVVIRGKAKRAKVIKTPFYKRPQS